MNRSVLCALAVLLLLTSCQKALDIVAEKNASPAVDPSGFTKYTISQGKQYCNQNTYKAVEADVMSFVVKFDSSAIYQAQSAENQYDINKLYGFSDNNQDHHQYSARIGWRWSDRALRLFAYVYNGGQVISKELAAVAIGAETACKIQVVGNRYVFTVNDRVESLPREATTEKGKGYQLYPYFGGDETAPHEINIWLKNL